MHDDQAEAIKVRARQWRDVYELMIYDSQGWCLGATMSELSAADAEFMARDYLACLWDDDQRASSTEMTVEVGDPLPDEEPEAINTTQSEEAHDRVQALMRHNRREVAAMGLTPLVMPVTRLLFELDPPGLAFAVPTAEYTPEAEGLLAKSALANGPHEIADLAYDEFCWWYMPSLAGDKASYAATAEQIWLLLEEHRKA